MNFWKVSTFLLTGTLLVVSAVALVPSAHADAQPRMQASLQLLEGAKQHLEAANDDKGGHRLKAIKATKEAIDATKKGIEFDNTHTSKDEKK